MYHKNIQRANVHTESTGHLTYRSTTVHEVGGSGGTAPV